MDVCVCVCTVPVSVSVVLEVIGSMGVMGVSDAPEDIGVCVICIGVV
jgi:hypothetical protein